ncbi:hypothetical protein JT358_01720 [Micrococcales bacterium 31B]|nr:hypothetical protein [Micrococcales bacterium 31B]
MKSTDSSACCGDDSHDHTPYSGAEIVRQLGSGYAILTLALPAAVLISFLTLAAFVPGDFATWGLGVGLGLLQYIASSAFTFAATRRRLQGRRPSLPLALTGAVTQEVLRVAVIAVFSLVFASWLKSNVIWLALGVAAGQLLALATTEFTSRRAMQRPSAWSQNQVEYVLTLGVSGHSITLRRAFEHLLTALWAVGATLLVGEQWQMAAAIIVLLFGVTLIGFMLQEKSPRQRLASPLAYFGPGVTLVVFVAGVLVVAAAPV